MRNNNELQISILTGLVCYCIAGIAIGIPAARSDSRIQDLRSLAREFMPQPSDLGEGWFRPWEVPVKPLTDALSEMGAEDTETDYWNQAMRRIGPWNPSSGVDLSHDSGMVAMELTRAINNNLPPDARLTMMWSVALEGIQESSKALSTLQPDLSLADHDRALMDALTSGAGAPVKNLGGKDLAERWKQASSFPLQRTEMSYFFSSDWDAFSNSGQMVAGLPPGVQFAVLSIRLTVCDPIRIRELEEISLSELSGRSIQLQDLMHRITKSSLDLQEKDLAWLKASVEKTIDESEREIIMNRINDLSANTERLRAMRDSGIVEISPLTQGDYGYRLIVRGFPPATSNDFTEFRTIWIRVGAKLVEVTLTGTVVSDESSIILDRVLALLVNRIGSPGMFSAAPPLPKEKHDSGKVYPDRADDLMIKAIELLDKGNFAEAETELRKILELNPAADDAWMNLANALGHQGQWTEAVKAIREAVRRQPEDPLYRADLAYALLQQGLREEALKEAKESLCLGLERSMHPVFDELDIK